MFLTGPDVVERVTREQVTALELGGPKVHGAQRRRAPRRRATTCTRPSMVRAALAHLPVQGGRRRCRCYPPADPAAGRPRRACCPRATREVYDVRDVAARLVDGGELLELGAALGAQPRRRLRPHRRARRSASSPTSPSTSAAAWTPTSSQKGAWFVDLCDRFGLPLVVLVDTPGFLPGASPGAGRRHPPRRLAAAGLQRRARRRASPSPCGRRTVARTSS